MRDLEHVSRLLAAWSGPGASWTATTLEASAPNAVPADGVSIAWRGSVEEQATKGVRRMRAWTRAHGVVAKPIREPHSDVCVVLSWIGAARSDLLRAYACEDVAAWQRYRRRLACYPLMADHAMASLMRPAKRRRVPGNDLARELGMRAGDYYAERRRMEDLLMQELQDASSEFMRKLGGKSKYPENDMVSRGRKYQPARHKRSTPWWRPESGAVVEIHGPEAEAYCSMHPSQSKLEPERIDAADVSRVVVPVPKVERQRLACVPVTRARSGRPRVPRVEMDAADWSWCRGPEFEFEPVLAEAA